MVKNLFKKESDVFYGKCFTKLFTILLEWFYFDLDKTKLYHLTRHFKVSLFLSNSYVHRHNFIAYQSNLLSTFIPNYLKDQTHFVIYQFDLKDYKTTY